ncbi:hypothetical protein C8J57DRAFT_1296867 [Mycena rebaudengoi]|nr:hypothetical protein C8J57DRAFT_1296867 [Mycena rebaudengoi]
MASPVTIFATTSQTGDVAFLTVTHNAPASTLPPPPPPAVTSSVNDGPSLPLAWITVASLAAGLFIGLLGAFIYYICRGRRSRPNNARDGEALLGVQKAQEASWTEKGSNPETLVDPAPLYRSGTLQNKVFKWLQRHDGIYRSASTASSAKPPTTVARSQSNASSRSAYSQASALYPDAVDPFADDGPGRGHGRLSRISE